MKPYNTVEVINGRRYNTETATLVAGDDWFDGHNFERHGRNTLLYRTAKGSYFAQHLTLWQGERHHLEPLTQQESLELWERLPERRVSFHQAFPDIDIDIEDA